MKSQLEFTVQSVLVGALLAVVMTAANVYLGLYAGMTVSASIPASVVGVAVLRGLMRRKGVLEANIVQTMASAGETLAAGVIFTLPALVIVGSWQDFQFIPTTMIAIAGGLLGVVFMVPLRKALIIEKKDELVYPEGVACATVLQSADGEPGALGVIAKGLGLGAVLKFFTTGTGWLLGSLEKAFIVSNRVFFLGFDLSPALLGVGYIVKLEVALLCFIGGCIGWFIGIPFLGLPAEVAGMEPLDAAWTMWSEDIRYIGVGAMLVGGLISIVSVKDGIISGLSHVRSSYKNRHESHNIPRTEQDISALGLGATLMVCFLLMFGLYSYLLGSFGLSLLTTSIMIVSAFPFVAVSSYITGLVGSSNTPISGVVIAVLLATAALFLAIGIEGDSGILVTLGVSAVVCCAVATASDCSQDLKTGYLVGATPRYQQIAQKLGVIIPAFTVAPVLALLHEAYGIGDGLKAPQASLFASMTKALFTDINLLPLNIIGYGALLGIIIVVIDKVLKARGSSIRLPLMPIAVGIYLPVTITVPMLLGGIVRHFVDKRRGSKEDGFDKGILLSSGFVAGESIMGILLAGFIVADLDLKMPFFGIGTVEAMTVAALIGLTFYLRRIAKSA